MIIVPAPSSSLLVRLSSSAALAVPVALLSDLVNDLVGDPEVLDRVAPDMDLGKPPELLAVGGRANDLFQVQVHEPVAVDEMSIVRLSYHYECHF